MCSGWASARAKDAFDLSAPTGLRSILERGAVPYSSCSHGLWCSSGVLPKPERRCGPKPVCPIGASVRACTIIARRGQNFWCSCRAFGQGSNGASAQSQSVLARGTALACDLVSIAVLARASGQVPQPIAHMDSGVLAGPRPRLERRFGPKPACPFGASVQLCAGGSLPYQKHVVRTNSWSVH